MLLLALMIYCSRRFGPVIIPMVRNGVAAALIILLLMPNIGVMTGDLSDSACHADRPADRNEIKMLREGTRIPPTTGRIVMLGRRWVFVAATDQEIDETVAHHDADIRRALLVTKVKYRPSRLGQSRRQMKPTKFRPTAAPIQEMNSSVPDALKQILLHENLMLQRIVEAIQADPTDDHWVVSGEVTEFFNENRLSIHLAQRANRR
jgi:hypothetical protein